MDKCVMCEGKATIKVVDPNAMIGMPCCNSCKAHVLAVTPSGYLVPVQSSNRDIPPTPQQQISAATNKGDGRIDKVAGITFIVIMAAAQIVAFIGVATILPSKSIGDIITGIISAIVGGLIIGSLPAALIAGIIYTSPEVIRTLKATTRQLFKKIKNKMPAKIEITIIKK